MLNSFQSVKASWKECSLFACVSKLVSLIDLSVLSEEEGKENDPSIFHRIGAGEQENIVWVVSEFHELAPTMVAEKILGFRWIKINVLCILSSLCQKSLIFSRLFSSRGHAMLRRLYLHVFMFLCRSLSKWIYIYRSF